MKFSTFEKVGFGLLVAAWVVWGSHQISGFLVHATELEKPAYAVEVADVAPAKSDTPAVVENAITLLASASLDKGAKVFKKCKSCHTVNKGGKNGVSKPLECRWQGEGIGRWLRVLRRSARIGGRMVL